MKSNFRLNYLYNIPYNIQYATLILGILLLSTVELNPIVLKKKMH